MCSLSGGRPDSICIAVLGEVCLAPIAVLMAVVWITSSLSIFVLLADENATLP